MKKLILFSLAVALAITCNPISIMCLFDVDFAIGAVMSIGGCMLSAFLFTKSA